MSPTTNPETLHLPARWTLEPRQGAPREERPLLRDEDGRVMAEVDRWTPDLAN